MNFFEHQQLARRNTRLMVVLFVLAVVSVVAAVDLGLASFYVLRHPESESVPIALHLLSAAGTVAGILGVSLFRIRQLSAGGAAVAQMVGARQLAPNTRDPLERRLLNVVEEMAIASGMRVPAVYVMDAERGINAFAAGWDVSGSVIAVTRGALQALTRDELQGVVAHEFSHILNGDMRLNIRMVGVLAGIVFIGALGRFMMGSLRGSRKKGQLFVLGLAMFVIGYIGVFFARLIKAAVARQREFLADASSVQFTRNPAGIAGALDQIRASDCGALIAHRRAEDMSHMFFGQGIKVWFAIFSTHPPIGERIARVDPGFQPVAYRQARAAVDKEITMTAPDQGAAGASQDGRRPTDLVVPWMRSASQSASLVGTLTPAKMDYAARTLAALPLALRDALREPQSAAAAVVALLLAPKDEVMQRQLQALAAAGHGALAERARAAALHTHGLGLAMRLPLVDLALPALKDATAEAKKALLGALEAVIHADRRVALHEFVVLTLVRYQLAPSTRPPASGKNLRQLRAEAGNLLSLMAHAGTRTDTTGQRHAALEGALRAGEQQMGISEQATPSAVPGLEAARASLDALKELAPLQKALLIKGLFAAATADGSIRVAEAELLRLVCAVLDSPLPPLLDEI